MKAPITHPPRHLRRGAGGIFDMTDFHKKDSPHHLEMSSINFISLLDRLDDGVMITDRAGKIIFYNTAQSLIDDISPRDALGLSVTKIYDLNDQTSMIMQCLERRSAIKNRTFFYRTISGKVAHTITSVYPLFTQGEVTGAVCFVKDYELLQRSTPMIASNECRPSYGNGTRFTFADLIGNSPSFQRAVGIARQSANSNSPIMLFGETGTGKELFAQSIHNHSHRHQKRYVAVNCAAIPDDLLEGLLFGTTKGAFTGAMDKPGLFEMAQGGSLFLDELLAMPIHLQAKLLRVLQEKKVRRLGSPNEIDVNVKIISAVSWDPRLAIQRNQLRIDLYYRLGVVLINIPPLRKRRAGMAELTTHFIEKLNPLLGTHVKQISPEVMELFMAYHWPGNVRELEHLMEGAMNLVGHDKIIDVKHLSPGMNAFVPMDAHLDKRAGTTPGDKPPPDSASLSPGNTRTTNNGARKEDDTPYPYRFETKGKAPADHAPSPPDPLPTPSDHTAEAPRSGRSSGLIQNQTEYEKSAVIRALEQSQGNVTQAAKQLGISRQLLHYKIKKHELKRKHFLP